MEGEDITHQRITKSVERKARTLKKSALDTRLDRAIKSNLKKKASVGKLKTNLGQEYSKNLFDFNNKGLLEILNRNDHFQNCSSCNTARLSSKRKKNNWISSGQKGVKFSTRKMRNTGLGATMKDRPHTARNLLSGDRENEYTMPGIGGNSTLGNEYGKPFGTVECFQENIGSFVKGNNDKYLMENEYLKTDVRGDGGNSSGAVWKRGYFLSTTMEKALGPVPTKSRLQAKTVDPSNHDKPRNLNSYINYELPDDEKEMQESVAREGGNDNANHQSSSGDQNELFGQIVNPCFLHNNQEIIYLDKTERRGLCKDCIKNAQENHHEVLSSHDAKEDARNLLVQLESNTMKMFTQKKELIQLNKQKFQNIESDRKNFIADQQKKINELHNYLDEKLRCLIAEYNKAVEPDVTSVKNILDRLEEKAQEYKIFILDIQTMLKTFSKNVIPNFIDNVSKCANMLNYYNHLKTLNSVETYTMVYPNHKRDYHPVFDMDVGKEIEILANKFRILSTPGVCVQREFSQGQQDQEIDNAASLISTQHLQYEEVKKENSFKSAGGVTQNFMDNHANLNDEKQSSAKEENSERKARVFETMPSPPFSTEHVTNTLVSVRSPVRKKLRIVRWLSKNIGEYDIENDFWNSVESKISKPFLPFSRTVYLPNQDMIVMGGLNDEIPNKPTFSSHVFKITEVPINVYDSAYVAKQKSNMITKRGCFSALYQFGFVFAFGGLNYTHKIMRYCEKYDVDNDIWEEIAPMVEPRKNCTSCALTSDTIYVFGGSSNHSETTASSMSTSDSVEQYCVSSDTWTLLKIRLPNPVSFQVSFKLSETTIILLGGSIKQHSRKTDNFKSNQVFVFDVMKPCFKRCNNLAKDVLSLYPAFYDDGSLYLVDEDESSENPLVVRYNISNLIN